MTAFGLPFKNPIGLAAGYDKDARAVPGLAALGFGHIEVGTVTPLAATGNPKPRLFRLPEDEAVINRMGFPSKGSAYMQRRLSPGIRGNWIGEMLGIPGRSDSNAGSALAAAHRRLHPRREHRQERHHAQR